jgi:hypothetical protein
MLGLGFACGKRMKVFMELKSFLTISILGANDEIK